MDVRRIMIGAMLAVLVSSPGFALAQGRGRRMGMGDSMGHDRGAVKQIEPLMQQMGGLMQQMAERIKAGPLTPDQALHLSGMMEQMATMMSKMAAGIPGADTGALLADMKVRLAEMQLPRTLPATPSASTGMGASPQKP